MKSHTEDAGVDDRGQGFDAGRLNGDDPCRTSSRSSVSDEIWVVTGADHSQDLQLVVSEKTECSAVKTYQYTDAVVPKLL